MLKGYNLIRNKRIIHRDLKPDNILFRSRSEYNKTIAIIDFGYCDVAEVGNKPQVYYNVGSPKYMAPEAHEDSLYS
jgi:serine/threonine protein kinase